MTLTNNPEEKIEIYKIAVMMHERGLASSFIVEAVEAALGYVGALELMELWSEATEDAERDEIIADLQDEIERRREKDGKGNGLRSPQIVFDDLARSAQGVLQFKQELRQIVDRWGGIAKLSRATGIPQPSLSRFFSSSSLPRNLTIYRIVEALLPPEAAESFQWESPISIDRISGAIWEKQNAASC